MHLTTLLTISFFALKPCSICVDVHLDSNILARMVHFFENLHIKKR